MAQTRPHSSGLGDARVPPNALDLEAAVLSAVFVLPEVLDVLMQLLRPEHFYSGANRKIFELFLELQAKGRPIDILTVRRALADAGVLERIGGSTYLAQLFNDVPSASDTHVVEYAREIRDKWRMRSLIATCQRVAAEGYSQVADVQSFIDQAEHAVFSIGGQYEGKGPEFLSAVMRERFQDLQSRAQSKDYGKDFIQTGIPSVDRLIVRFQPGDVVVLAARPGVGKTSFAVNTIALGAAKRGLGTGILSMEMSREQLTDRLMCSEARIDSRQLHHPEQSVRLTKSDWTRLVAAAGALHKLPVVIEDRHRNSRGAGDSQADSVQAQGKRLCAQGASD